MVEHMEHQQEIGKGFDFDYQERVRMVFSKQLNSLVRKQITMQMFTEESREHEHRQKDEVLLWIRSHTTLHNEIFQTSSFENIKIAI